jgi:hypothetical protein
VEVSRSPEGRQTVGYDVVTERWPEHPMLNEPGVAQEVLANMALEKAETILKIELMWSAGWTWNEIGAAVGKTPDGARMFFARFRQKVEEAMRIEGMER